jgi:hypothetical protein
VGDKFEWTFKCIFPLWVPRIRGMRSRVQPGFQYMVSNGKKERERETNHLVLHR